MKKINKHFLADISLELSPLAEDNEGMLRGGFAGLGGNDIDASNTDDHCVNDTCSNSPCTNAPCLNKDCDNKHCSNKYCGMTTTSSTTKPNGGEGFNGLLI